MLYMHSQSHSGDQCDAEDLLKGTALYKGRFLGILQPSKEGTLSRLKIFKMCQVHVRVELLPHQMKHL